MNRSVDDLDKLSGPWAGWSIQSGLRLTETFAVTVRGGRFHALGSDIDGKFEVLGSIRDGEVRMTRKYTWCPPESPGSIGFPFDYVGRWDGTMIAGDWQERGDAVNGGTFEMWPDGEVHREMLRLETEEPLVLGANR